MRRTLLLTLAALVLAVAVAGCGDDDGASSATTDWASGVCTAISTWTDALEVAAGQIGGARSPGTLQAVAGDVKDATDVLVDDLQALGPPETDAGQKAKATLDELAGQLSASVQTIQDAVSDISGLAGLAGAGQKVATTVASMGAAIQTAFSELEDLDATGELEDAFESADSCDALTERSSS